MPTGPDCHDQALGLRKLQAPGHIGSAAAADYKDRMPVVGRIIYVARGFVHGRILSDHLSANLGREFLDGRCVDRSKARYA